MPSCVVKWCRSHTDMKNSGITFHIFPKNEAQRKKWVSAVRMERNESDWMPSECSKICSIHFRSDDIYMCSNGKLKRLRKTAVPVCTMVRTSTIAESYDNLCRPLSNDVNTDAQGDDSTASKEDEYMFEVKLEEVDGDMVQHTLHESGDTYLEVEQSTREKYTFYPNENSFNSCGNVGKEEPNYKLDEIGYGNMEDKKGKLVECPSCKFNIYVPTEHFEDEARIVYCEEIKHSCSTPSYDRSPNNKTLLNTSGRPRLKKILLRRTALARKRLLKIKMLQREYKKLKNKYLKQKVIIAKLKLPNLPT